MTKFSKTYEGGSLRNLLFQYSTDRSKEDTKFKAEFDAAQADARRLRAAKQKVFEEGKKEVV
jgi:hypothetical protein